MYFHSTFSSQGTTQGACAIKKLISLNATRSHLLDDANECVK